MYKTPALRQAVPSSYSKYGTPGNRRENITRRSDEFDDGPDVYTEIVPGSTQKTKRGGKKFSFNQKYDEKRLLLNFPEVFGNKVARLVRDDIKKQGYDSILYKNAYEDGSGLIPLRGSQIELLGRLSSGQLSDKLARVRQQRNNMNLRNL